MVFHHYSDLVKLLIEHGADVNIIGGSNQWTPLFYAAQSGHATAVELLLHTGADAQVGGATVCNAIYMYMLKWVGLLYALLYIPICSSGWDYGMHCYIYLYSQVGGATVCIAICDWACENQPCECKLYLVMLSPISLALNVVSPFCKFQKKAH